MADEKGVPRSRIISEQASVGRAFPVVHLDADLVVVGGGMSGTCCAITAARAGLKVALVQDRPVLGGNASSEVRLWISGATAHGTTNNRWAREGGVIDEILVENLYRNPEGNPVLFDALLLEKVSVEPNITLLLDTALTEASRKGDQIDIVRALCSLNQTVYDIAAPLYCDASGDGVLGFLAGASFRMGAEPRAEFDELVAPSEEWGTMLGHSLFFYTKEVGRPVRFIPPSFALHDLSAIPTYRSFNTSQQGCMLWWVEYGGRMDTIRDTERIKWELWRIVYGIWNHLKNSGEFPEAETLTLEWVGLIPGRRESRRFNGLYMLRQSDIVERRTHEDAVAYGGWAIDLHPADGVFSERAMDLERITLFGRAVYQIPYRCLVSRDITNLFLAGRIISASHVAFGSSRVMGTGATTGQAVGTAAALCLREGVLPAGLLEDGRIRLLQRDLTRTGQYIPGVHVDDPLNIASTAEITASSEYRLNEFIGDGEADLLGVSRAMLLPMRVGTLPRFETTVDVAAKTMLRVELRAGASPDDFTPDSILGVREIPLEPGEGQHVSIDFGLDVEEDRYVFLCFMKNADISLRTSSDRVTGVLAVRHSGDQSADPSIGRPFLEFWSPERRPGGRNLAIRFDPPICPFRPANVVNGVSRPTARANAWVPDPNDQERMLTLRWDSRRVVARIELSFDSDFDHPMESILRSHPESIIPFCAAGYQVLSEGRVVATGENHQTRAIIIVDPPLVTDHIQVQLLRRDGAPPPALFDVRVYED